MRASLTLGTEALYKIVLLVCLACSSASCWWGSSLLLGTSLMRSNLLAARRSCGCIFCVMVAWAFGYLYFFKICSLILLHWDKIYIMKAFIQTSANESCSWPYRYFALVGRRVNFRTDFT